MGVSWNRDGNNRKRIDCVFMVYLAISLACSVSFLSPLCRDSPPFLSFYACHSRILIVRARIAHGEINVFDGANFITITVTRIIKLCYCSAVCLPSSFELRATRQEDRQKTKDNSCHYLDRHKNRTKRLLLLSLSTRSVQFLANNYCVLTGGSLAALSVADI